MPGQYDAVAERALATITRKGAAVVFTVTGGAHVYDPLTDTWSGGTTGSVTGRAVQVPDNPMKLQTIGLVITNPITLIVAGAGLATVPVPEMSMLWAGVMYIVKSVEAVAPDGATPISYAVIGSRG